MELTQPCHRTLPGFGYRVGFHPVGGFGAGRIPPDELGARVPAGDLGLAVLVNPMRSKRMVDVWWASLA